MNVIAVECPACRIIQAVESSCLLLEVIATEEEDERIASASWICHRCQRLVALPIDLTVLLDLVAAGASVLDASPDENRPPYPESAIDGGPLVLDDLIDFHEKLETDALLADALCREAPEECPPQNARQLRKWFGTPRNG
jgi:hypothetical protein